MIKMTIRHYNFLSGDYAKRLDQTMRHLWGQGDVPNSTERRELSLFYYFRPIQLTSDWIRTEYGSYKARAQFLTLNSEGAYILQESPTIEVYSPTDLSTEPSSVSGDYGWAVFRGRWEILSCAGTGDSGGGSEEAGHLIGTTLVAITGSSETTTVVVGFTNYIVSCPLLAAGDSIGAYTKVVISKNRASGTWEIICWPAQRGHHMVGTTSSSITGPEETTRVEGKTVTCPLLNSTQMIRSGTTVVISQNQVSGMWEIIEARCATD